METASSAILNTPHTSTITAKLYSIQRKNISSLSYPSLSTPRASGLRFRGVRFNGSVNCSSSLSSNTPKIHSQQLALLFEIEGVLMDIYRFGNQQAFNAAFQKLGLDCASWTQPVYLDLVKKSYGDEERMLVLYFNKIGWPTSLPTNEKQSFLKRALSEKKNALDDLIISKTLPLRPGVEIFIDDALEEGIPVVMMMGSGEIKEKVARSIIEKLGSQRVSKIKIIEDEVVKRSLYGQFAPSEGVSSDLGKQSVIGANKAVSAEDLRITNEVSSMLKSSIDINTASSECFENIVAALRAGAEHVDTPIDKCILVAGSQSWVSAAVQIGMLCVAVRSSLTANAEFHGANVALDGFDGEDLTISRLRQIQNI
ncbi:unnamed protein product [Cuscuta epithymum]|uniref:Haloacid dehalogenase-like hydrolase domain-containing protein n=1 Tax=Cuscuta epithymum TaxID=186058 RepID=A0AAV0G108_9ASTE|nr:unnamed protein product [Cuscuta epithymum]